MCVRYSAPCPPCCNRMGACEQVKNQAKVRTRRGIMWRSCLGLTGLRNKRCQRVERYARPSCSFVAPLRGRAPSFIAAASPPYFLCSVPFVFALVPTGIAPLNPSIPDTHSSFCWIPLCHPRLPSSHLYHCSPALFYSRPLELLPAASTRCSSHLGSTFSLALAPLL